MIVVIDDTILILCVVCVCVCVCVCVVCVCVCVRVVCVCGVCHNGMSQLKISILCYL